MAETVNFTGAVDRDLLRRAKILAAKSDTSVNALFNAELRYLVETLEAAEASGNQNFRTLFDFSLGRVDDRQAMQARPEHAPQMMRMRRKTVERSFGTIKAWMGATRFLTRTIERNTGYIRIKKSADR